MRHLKKRIPAVILFMTILFSVCSPENVFAKEKDTASDAVPVTVSATDFVADAKTNIGLVNFAYKALHENWGYCYGATGQICTESNINMWASYLKDKYTDHYKGSCRRWLGRRVTDCSGLIKSYCWWTGDGSSPSSYLNYSLTRYGADQMLAGASESGSLSNMPDIPGLLVHKKEHVGVYVGNGKVIEARGVYYGVVMTDLNSRGWTAWSKSPFLSYIDSGVVKINQKAVRIKDGKISSKGGFYKVGKKKYYLQEDGMIAAGNKKIKGVLYGFTKTGECLGAIDENGYITRKDGSFCHVSKNGTVLTGLYFYRGYQYYFADGMSHPALIGLDTRCYPSTLNGEFQKSMENEETSGF